MRCTTRFRMQHVLCHFRQPPDGKQLLLPVFDKQQDLRKHEPLHRTAGFSGPAVAASGLKRHAASADAPTSQHHAGISRRSLAAALRAGFDERDTLCCGVDTAAADIPQFDSQFPGPKDEGGGEDEPEGVEEARREGRQPKVDKPEEAAAPTHEYEFQPQVGFTIRDLDQTMHRQSHRWQACNCMRRRCVNDRPFVPTVTGKFCMQPPRDQPVLTLTQFNVQEEQLLELVMNGMRVAGIALALQALSTLTLGAAQANRYPVVSFRVFPL